MAVKIGHASIDENGKAYGGQAGDQTGKEVCVRNWYLNSKGWDVLRAKDAAVAEKIAKCMEDACRNDCIGYDQWQRDTLYNAVKDNGFECGKAFLTKKVETDCSALVRVCLAYAGISVENFRTYNEKNTILATGKFDELPIGSTSDYLKRGDILITKTAGHTAVVLSDGTKAHQKVEVNKVNITLNELKRGNSGNQVRTLQQLLIANGYKMPKYGADADFGAETETALKAFQKANRLTADGIAGTNTWNKLLKG